MKEWLYDWNGLNTALFHWVNMRDYPHWWDALMLFGSELSHRSMFPTYTTILALLTCLFALLAWRIPQDARFKRWGIAWGIVLIVFVAGHQINGLWVGALKEYMHYPRPFVFFPEGQVRVVWPTAIDGPYASFPSGHTVFAMLFTASLWPALNGVGRFFAALFVVWAGLSRLVVGVHFPADIVITAAMEGGQIFLLYMIVKRSADWTINKVKRLRAK